MDNQALSIECAYMTALSFPKYRAMTVINIVANECIGLHCIFCTQYHPLTHLGRDEMTTDFPTTSSSAFYLNESEQISIKIPLKFCSGIRN